MYRALLSLMVRVSSPGLLCVPVREVSFAMSVESSFLRPTPGAAATMPAPPPGACSGRHRPVAGAIRPGPRAGAAWVPYLCLEPLLATGNPRALSADAL